MAGGPLDDPRLREVEACLNEGRFDEAQHKLVGLGGVRALGPGVAYLTTRLLAQRGRLDAVAITERMQDVLSEAPDFPEAQSYLSSVRPPPVLDIAHAPTLAGNLDPRGARLPTVPAPAPMPGSIRAARPPLTVSTRMVSGPPSARPLRLETPRVPPLVVHAPVRPKTADLGTLEPPRSELPTDPAPPPSEPSSSELPRFEPEPPSVTARGIWDPVELDLASGRVEAALSALEKQAGLRLDQLVARRMPEFEAVAEQAADFLASSPIVCHFPAYDLSLGSLARLDAALALFARRPQRAPRYALSVLLSAYVGECVRRASGGRWLGRLAEPDMATIERPRGECFQPWRAVHLALTEGSAVHVSAGGTKPGLSSSNARRPLDPPSAWAPEPWPPFALFHRIGRVVPGSVLGTWAARVAHVPLDRSIASLGAVDQYLALLATSASVAEASGGWARRAAVLTGAYVGEVLCLNGGARWSENTDVPLGPLRFELVTPDGGAAYPVLWALERLRGQAKGSIVERARGVLTA